MKKKNLLVLGALVVLIAVVAMLAVFMPQTRTIPQDAPSLPSAEPVVTAAAAPETTDAPEGNAAASADPAAVQATEMPAADAYLVITVQGQIFEPLPLLDEGVFTIRQSETVANTVHITKDSVWMEHSTCDNQDCVDQGTVSLDNITSRVLYNMIICLPNQVSLELHTPETLAVAFGLAE